MTRKTEMEVSELKQLGIRLLAMPKAKVYKDIYIPAGDTSLFVDFICRVGTKVYLLKQTKCTKTILSAEIYTGDSTDIESINPMLYMVLAKKHLEIQLGSIKGLVVRPMLFCGSSCMNRESCSQCIDNVMKSIVSETFSVGVAPLAESQDLIDKKLSTFINNKEVYIQLYA